MLKQYADTFQLAESDTGQAAMDMMRSDYKRSYLAIAGYALLYLMTVITEGADKPDGVGLVMIIAAFLLVVVLVGIGSVSAIRLFTSPLVNRVWARDRYLDEWELARKREAMAFSFQIVMYALIPVLFVGLILYFVPQFSAVEVGGLGIGATALTLLMIANFAMVHYLVNTVTPLPEDAHAPLEGPSGEVQSKRRRYTTWLLAVSGITGIIVGIVMVFTELPHW